MMVALKIYTVPLKHDSTYTTVTSSEHLAQCLASCEKNTKNVEHISFPRKNRKYTDTTQDDTTTTATTI